MNDHHPTEPCPRCGNAHEEPLCDDEMRYATAMQMAAIIANDLAEGDD